VVDLFDQQLLAIDRLAKISLHTLASNRHPEDIGDALKKHDVALSKFPSNRLSWRARSAVFSACPMFGTRQLPPLTHNATHRRLAQPEH
jgi:hypothetical protein